MLYKLLIVEDEYEIRRGLISQIDWNELGFEVEGEAENGSEALKMLSSITPDVIITDIRMPVMDGIELMHKLREINSKVKIVILSAFNEFEYAKKSIQYEAFSYILKPTRDEEISDVFRKLKNRLDSDYNIDCEHESCRKKAEIGKEKIKSSMLQKLAESSINESEREYFLRNLAEVGVDINNYWGVISCEVNSSMRISNEVNGRMSASYELNSSMSASHEVNSNMKISKEVNGSMSIFCEEIPGSLFKEAIRNIIINKEELDNTNEEEIVNINKEELDNTFKEETNNKVISKAEVNDKCIEITELFISGETGTVHFIISGRMPVNRNESIKIAEKIKAKIEQFISDNVSETCVVSTGAGNFYKDVFSLNDSYAQSKRALNLKFFLGLGKSFHHDEYLNFNRIYSNENNFSTDVRDEYKLLNAIAESIFEMRSDLLKDSLHKYLKYIRMKTMELEHVSVKIIEMIMFLNSKLIDKDISINIIFGENTYAEVNNIILTGTFNQLHKYLLDNGNSLIDIIGGKIMDDLYINKAKKFISMHYSERITLVDVSRFVSLSPTYLSCLFKQKTGYSFINYLTLLRMEKAKELLCRPNSMVKEVAMSVGFNDVRHFGKIFKKLEGVIPSEYKYTSLLTE